MIKGSRVKVTSSLNWICSCNEENTPLSPYGECPKCSSNKYDLDTMRIMGQEGYVLRTFPFGNNVHILINGEICNVPLDALEELS